MEERQVKAIWIEMGLVLAMDVVLEGGVIFTAVDPEPEFRGKRSRLELVQATESGNIFTALRECEFVDLWSGAMKSIWGIYSANGAWLVAANGDGHWTGQAGQTDKQWTNELLATHNGQNGKMEEAQRGLTSEPSTGACPFVREATLLPDYNRQLWKAQTLCPLASRVSSSFPLIGATFIRTNHCRADPFCQLILPATVRQKTCAT